MTRQPRGKPGDCSGVISRGRVKSQGKKARIERGETEDGKNLASVGCVNS